MVYLANTFSLDMLGADPDASVIISRQTTDEARRLLLKHDFVSVVDHADTAKLLSDILGTVVAFNQSNITLRPWADALFAAQYYGPHLEEGTTSLPDGAGFRFYMVFMARVKSVVLEPPG